MEVDGRLTGRSPQRRRLQPVAGGEQDNDLAQWRRMIRMNAVDIVQPDLLYVGGLTRALRIAAMAAAHKKMAILRWSTMRRLTSICGNR